MDQSTKRKLSDEDDERKIVEVRRKKHAVYMRAWRRIDGLRKYLLSKKKTVSLRLLTDNIVDLEVYDNIPDTIRLRSRKDHIPGDPYGRQKSI